MTFFYICSNSGNDSNSGNSDSPFKTIQHAASLAVPGDSILVKPGIYRERISPTNSGTRKKDEFYELFENKNSEGFDPEKDLVRIGVINQTTMLASETEEISEFLKTKLEKLALNGQIDYLIKIVLTNWLTL